MNGIKSQQFTVYLMVSNCTKLLMHCKELQVIASRAAKPTLSVNRLSGGEERMRVGVLLKGGAHSVYSNLK